MDVRRASQHRDGYYQDTKEPTGFLNKTDSTLSFDNATRTFTITPASTLFKYYSRGVFYYKSAAESIVISNTEGIHYIYYDGDTLQETTTSSLLLYTEYASVADVYWDTSAAARIHFGEERHGITMPGSVHYRIHIREGTGWVSGLALGDFSVDGDGSNNSHAQFSCSAGFILDEDNLIEIIDGSPQDITPTLTLPVYYRSGASDWNRTAASTYPVITGASGRLAWNQLTGGSWQQTDVSNGSFVLAHIFATNDLDFPVIAVQGQVTYNNVPSARTGAEEEIKSLSTFGLPFAEFVAVGSIIFQTSDSYTNAVKARIRTTDVGENYVDFRQSQGISAGNPFGLPALPGLEVSSVRFDGAKGDGVTDDYTSINAAVAALGSDEQTLYFGPGTYYIGTSLTVPKNIKVRFDKGAIITDNGDAGVVFTVQDASGIDAGAYQIFDFTGAGSGVTFTNGGEGWLNWWCDGGTGTSSDPWTSSFDSASGLQEAHDSGLRVIKATSGFYSSTAQASWTTSNLTLQGSGLGSTDFVINGAMTSWLDLDGSYFDISGFTLWGSMARLTNPQYRDNVVTAGINLTSFTLSNMQNVTVIGVYGSGVRFVRCIRSRISDVEVTYCGDTGKPAWHFDGAAFASGDIVQGSHFDRLGFEVNFNDDVWVSESSAGNGDGAGYNTYNDIRFENSTDSFCRVTVTLGTPSNGDAVTITGGITATMEAYVTSGTYGDAMQIDDASAYTFGIGDTITGPAGAWTATIDEVDHQNGQFIDWNDIGAHRVDNIQLNRAGVLSDYCMLVQYTERTVYSNIKLTGPHAGGIKFSNSNYITLSNLNAYGSPGSVALTSWLMNLNDCDGGTFTNIASTNFFGILIDGNSDQHTISNVNLATPGDVPASGCIDVGSSCNDIVFNNCRVNSATQTGPIFKIAGVYCTLDKCDVAFCAACSWAVQVTGGANKILGGTISNSEQGIYFDSGTVCLIDSVTFIEIDKHGIYVDTGASRPIIRGCYLDNYATDGAGYSGIYLDGSLKTKGFQVSGNTFRSSSGTPDWDLYTANGYSDCIITDNNFNEGCANGVRVGSGFNKQISGNVGALENKVSMNPDSVSTSGTGEQDMMTATIARYSNDPFERIRIRAAGTITGANGNKTINFYFGSESVTFYPAANNANDWLFEAEVALKTDTDHRCLWKGIEATNVTASGYDAFTNSLDSGAITVKCTGNCADGADVITQTMFVVELL